MKRLLVGVRLIATMSLLSACAGGGAAAPTAVPIDSAVKAGEQIVAEARVVPVRSAALSFETAGTVAEVVAKEGEIVQTGQVLARLDNANQAANVARAEAQLKAAQARLEDLTDGPRVEDVAATEAQLRQAQAQLQQVVEGVTPEDITAAQAQIQAAQATLGRLQSGAQNPDVRAAQSSLEAAQSGLESQRNQLSAGKTNAEKQLQQAAEQLVQAQTTYSTAKYQWEYVERTGNDPNNPTTVDAKSGKAKDNSLNDFQRQQYADNFIRAEAQLRAAEQAVAQAQVGYDSARQSEITGLSTAEQNLAGAQANLDRVLSSIKSEQLANARSQLASARANLSKLRGPQRELQIAVAQAGVDAAQANLVRLKAPPQPSELTASQAQVDSAKAELDSARVAFSRTELKAPFPGLVALLDLRTGENIMPGTAIVQLADTSEWQVETTDLTELSVVRVREGAAVVITLDALPGVELLGKVIRVRGFGDNRQGDIVYRVYVRPERMDERMRWNMTASVSIEAQ
jgi:HlyD family secretion protein